MPTREQIEKKHPSWHVPDFTEQSFGKKEHAYCVCVFVINEGEKVRKQLKAMQRYGSLVDIVVADGGSTDGSLAPDFLRDTGVRTLLTKTGPGKLSAQMRMAFAWALCEGYDGVVVVDGNGKDDISALPEFIRLLDAGYDHIQGSRFIKGGRAVNTPLERLVAVRLVHSPLISVAARHRHTDTTNGFRAYSRALLEDPRIAVFRDVFQTYELHYHLAIESARAKKYKLIETPVTRTYPKKGKTPTKISPVRGSAHVLGVLSKAARGKYRYRG
jgi:dolichol-phosphate mannosyltransferase